MIIDINKINFNQINRLYITSEGQVAENTYCQRLYRWINPFYNNECLCSIAEKLLTDAPQENISKKIQKQWTKISKAFLRAVASQYARRELRKSIRKIDQVLLAQSLKIKAVVFEKNPLFYEFAKAHHLDKCLSFQNAEGLENRYEHKVKVDENDQVSLMINGGYSSWETIKNQLKVTEEGLTAIRHAYLSKGLEENCFDTNKEIKILRVRKLKPGENLYQFQVKIDYSPYSSLYERVSKFNFGHAWVYRISPDENNKGYVKEESIGYFLWGKLVTPDLRGLLPNAKQRKIHKAKGYNKEKHDRLTRIIEGVMALTVGANKPNKLEKSENKAVEDVFRLIRRGGTCAGVALKLLEQVEGFERTARIPMMSQIFTQRVIKFLDYCYEHCPHLGRVGDIISKIQLITRGAFPYYISFDTTIDQDYVNLTKNGTYDPPIFVN